MATVLGKSKGHAVNISFDDVALISVQEKNVGITPCLEIDVDIMELNRLPPGVQQLKGLLHEGCYRGGKNGAVFAAGQAIIFDIESVLSDLAATRPSLMTYEIYQLRSL